MTQCRIVNIGLTVTRGGGLAAGKMTVSVVLDGEAQRSCKVTKPEGRHSAVTIFKRPLHVGLGWSLTSCLQE